MPNIANLVKSIQDIMRKDPGTYGDAQRIEQMAWLFFLKIFDDREGWEVQNQLLAGSLVTRAALWREESRGTHFRVDRSEASADYRVHDLWQRGQTDPGRAPVADSSSISS
jgi:aspartate oxidase